VVKEAESLYTAGHDVMVVSTKATHSVETRDRAIIDNVAWPVTRIDFSNSLRRKASRMRQLISRSIFACSGISGFADSGSSGQVYALRATASKLPADLYIAHYVAALPAVALAARYHGARYAFDAEDYHVGEHAHRSVEGELTRVVESKYLTQAAYVTAASPMIAEAYSETYKLKLPVVLLNVFPTAYAPPKPYAKGGAQPGPSLYWFSQTIGPGRGLECAIEGISRAQSNVHLYLRGEPVSGYERSLRAAAGELGVGNRLHLLPPVMPQELERLGADYDLGYAGEVGNCRNREFALTNKFFSYLLSGIPIIMSSIPAHQAFAHQLGPAARMFETNDAISLAKAIDSYLLDESFLKQARAHAWRLAQDRFNWDIEQNKLLGCVSTALEKHQ
jgi:glycosyltransferase involved in cell wall biosynthesis